MCRALDVLLLGKVSLIKMFREPIYRCVHKYQSRITKTPQILVRLEAKDVPSSNHVPYGSVMTLCDVFNNIGNFDNSQYKRFPAMT